MEVKIAEHFFDQCLRDGLGLSRETADQGVVTDDIDDARDPARPFEDCVYRIPRKNLYWCAASDPEPPRHVGGCVSKVEY
jgi:hypothetical protein